MSLLWAPATSCFFLQAEDGIRGGHGTGVQTCALPICSRLAGVTGPVPDGDHTVPIGVAEVKRAGRDVTVVGLAYYVRVSLAVAESLAKEGISVEVLDPRTLVPMDAATIRA